jgi:hypothetical protein
MWIKQLKSVRWFFVLGVFGISYCKKTNQGWRKKVLGSSLSISSVLNFCCVMSSDWWLNPTKEEKNEKKYKKLVSKSSTPQSNSATVCSTLDRGKPSRMRIESIDDTVVSSCVKRVTWSCFNADSILAHPFGWEFLRSRVTLAAGFPLIGPVLGCWSRSMRLGLVGRNPCHLPDLLLLTHLSQSIGFWIEIGNFRCEFSPWVGQRQMKLSPSYPTHPSRRDRSPSRRPLGMLPWKR